MTRNPSPRLLALYGIRNAVDALIIEEERIASVQTEEAAPGCPNCGADLEHVRDISTIDGTRRGICERCGAHMIFEGRRAVLDRERTITGG